MDWLTVLGILAFAVGLLLSIALHEIGHLVPAKLFGIKVSQYMVGFGRTVWSRHRGETEYGFKAVPFGGYVRMVGMFPPEPGDGSSVCAPGQHRTVPGADRGRAPRVEGGDQARRRGPGLLPQGVVEEAHRDARRSGDERPHRGRAGRRRPDDLWQSHRARTAPSRQRGVGLRHPGGRRQPARAPLPTRRRRPRTRGSSPETGWSPSTANR